MFTEELAGNASRRKQEQARARRKQLKQEQQKKAPTATPIVSPASTSRTPAVVPLVAASTTALPLSTTTTSTKATTAKENAAIQRQVRQLQGLQKQASMKITSVLVWYTTNIRIQNEYRNSLTKKLKDVELLRTLLLETQKTAAAGATPTMAFLPPEATCNKLIMELLFTCQNFAFYTQPTTTTTTNHKLVLQMNTQQDLENFQHILEYILIPDLENTLSTTNDNSSLILSWISSKQGSYRMKCLLRLCLVTLTMISTSNTILRTDAVTTCIFTFFKKLWRVTSSSSNYKTWLLSHFGSGIPLLPTTTTNNNTTTTRNILPLPYSYLYNSTLDIIYILRYYLLYCTSKDHYPIPKESTSLREKSIHPPSIPISSFLWDYTMDLFKNNPQQQQQSLESRIFKQLFTVPFLTWKLSSSSLFKLFEPNTTTATTTATTTIAFISILVSFMKDTATSTNIHSVFPNVDDYYNLTHQNLTLACPATNTQCLLANLIPMSHLCPLWDLNSKTSTSLDYSSLTLFFYLLSTLVDSVPIGTFLTRDSAVIEWVVTEQPPQLAKKSLPKQQQQTHHTPIVLSSVILDQCKLLLLDSYVRKLFILSTQPNHMLLEDILTTKQELDLQHEQDLVVAANGGDDDSKMPSSTTNTNIRAATLAQREAQRKETNRITAGFWNSSKWAKKLTKGVSNLLSNNNNNPDTTTTTTSSSSSSNKKSSSTISTTNDTTMTTADSSTSTTSTSTSTNNNNKGNDNNNNFQLYFALCRTYGIILARWGGHGNEDILLSGSQQQQQTSMATSKADPCVISLLNVLCFSTDIVKSSWAFLQANTANTSDSFFSSKNQNLLMADIVHVIQTTTTTASSSSSNSSNTIRSTTIRPIYTATTIQELTTTMNKTKATTTKSNSSNNNIVTTAVTDTKIHMKNDGLVLLFVFLTTLSHTLIITDDIEIHNMGKPIPLHQIRRCIILLKKLLFHACNSSLSSSSSSTTNYFGLALISCSVRTMHELYNRSSRRPICVPKLWLTNEVDNIIQQQMKSCNNEHGQYVHLLLTSPILRVCPFLVSFKLRLKLFERIVTTNRHEIQGVHDNMINFNTSITNTLFGNNNNSIMNSLMNNNPLKPGIPVQIMRGRVLEDGLLTLNKLGKNLKQRIAVQYVNEAGSKEVGVDAGGLFKEFWTDLCQIAFDPNYALFHITEGNDNCLYPCPSSLAAHGPDHIVLFEFLGRILGKALYEGITIHPQFAHFFLSFLRGDYNYLHMLPDLSTIDQQLYNNLMFLKTYDGDAEDLCLSFTVTSSSDFGENKQIPLMPNGQNISVTNSNKQRYIGLVAKYYVVDRVKEQSEAFTRGLWEVIDRSWLRLFNEPELQVLISGATDGRLDVDDMRAHTRYVGGYTGLERVISRFWNVLKSFNVKQQGQLLRFVTSCERPPPLGFAHMNPPFTIQRVGTLMDGGDNVLPSSSTCFNTLKLPTYSSEKVLRQRLLYAIESGAGFELT